MWAGSHPTSYADYRLATNSLGKGKASDGLDIGARIEPPATGSGPGAQDSRACRKAKAKVDRRKHKLRHASGHKQRHEAKRKLRKAKRKKRKACGRGRRAGL